MGIVRFQECQKAEIEEFRRMLLSCAGLNRKKDDDDEFNDLGRGTAQNDEVYDRMVCVTSGVSYLGIAIVNQLLVRGYSVRIVVDNEEDVEKLREMEMRGEMRLTNSRIEVIMAKLIDEESLSKAFDGCSSVFHTAAFVDPAGLSGYTKAMAAVEVKASKNVLKACAITPSVRQCVFTSSLLACIWQDKSLNGVSCRIDHDSWSDESVCINKKLWLALGKLRAEKAAWEIAKENGLKLATICPGLITGPEFQNRNPTSTVAYLKGAQEMYGNGLLATVDVAKLAKAHLCVFEEMKKTAYARYLYFNQILESEEQIERLAREIGMTVNIIRTNSSCSNSPRYELSNLKLVQLMLRTQRCQNESRK